MLSCAAGMARADRPTSTQAAQTQPVESSVQSLVQQLGDPDASVREKATKSLWSMGRPAEGALREASAGADPEVAKRARTILRDFAYGLYPDTPPEIFGLLESYRKGDPQDKRIAVWGLSSKGIAGLRVLLKLREEETDPNLRQVIGQVLGPREHEISVLMLAGGQKAELEQLLEHSASISSVAAQDYAALLQSEGKLAARLAEVKRQPPNASSETMVIALARAAGDLPTARAAAQASGNNEVLNAILAEQRDWKSLASRTAEGASDLRAVEELGYLCAYQRLSGDTEGAKKTAKRLAEFGDMHPEDYLTSANDLFLNDAPDQAIALLLRRHDYTQVSNFLASRLQFAEALGLPKLAAEHQPGDETQVKARTVSTLQFVGKTAEAQALMARVQAENQLRNDFGTWPYLIEAAREMNDPKKAEELAASALEKATKQDSVSLVFEKLRLGDPSACALWWHFLKSQYGDDSAANNLKRLRSILDGSLTADQLEEISRLARRYAVDLNMLEREQWQETVTDAFTASGKIDLARQWITRLEETGSASALVHAGDFHADRKEWPAAIEDYSKAFERDHTQASALFLQGWAMAQSGNVAGGTPLMEQAHQLPLGNETGRYALVEALGRHQLTDDMRREFDLIIHATAPRSWERNDAMRRLAQLDYDKGEFSAAADLWEQAFLQNYSAGVSFTDPWAYAVVPSLVHKTRALGLIQSNQPAEALAQTKLAMDDTPGDADALIELVNAFDKADQKAQANELYSRQIAIYQKCIADYPASGPLHNQIAWAQCMCHRDLQDALKNAKRAVELEPTSTASLDTLAEAYFASGDPASAAAQMKRCIELEPKVERHRQQLKRFEAAAAAK